MAKFQVLTDTEVKKMYPKNKASMLLSATTRRVRKALEHGMVLVLVKDSKLSNMDYPEQDSLCLHSLYPNYSLLPGKCLKFNCIVDRMVSDTEILAACVSEDVLD